MPVVDQSQLLVVITGPTGTGKTLLGVKMAQYLHGCVISADSRQVYRGFDIGTAKPTPHEQAGVPHYLLDVADPQETYTVAQYQTAAQDHIQALHQGGQIPFLVGGTGLYLDAVTAGLTIPPVPPQPELRAKWHGVAPLVIHQHLTQVAPQAAARIHPNDSVRALRALEILHTLGHIPERTRQEPAYPVVWIGLDLSEPYYSQRLAQRTQNMIQQGWLQEIQTLQQRYGPELPLLRTLGYRELGAYLLGGCSLEAACAETVLRTRQYAKRQRTWLKRYTQMRWFDPQQHSLDHIAALLCQELGAR